MKHAILLFVTVVLSWQSYAQAQRNENIVINGQGSGNTIIEIHRDGVYVNGEQVASRGDLEATNLNKRITVTGATGNSSTSAGANLGSTGAGRALLGVVTNAQHDRAGAYVVEVNKGSAADQAGLRKGDLIIRVDSIYISDANDLISAIRSYEPGASVRIRYRRDEKEHTTTAKLDAAPATSLSRIFEFEPNGDSYSFGPGLRRILDDINPFESGPRLGMRVEEMADEGGVRVLDISPDLPAAKGGIQVNDVIVGIEGSEIDTMSDLERYLTNLKEGSTLRFEVLRGGSRITKSVTIPREKRVRSF